MMSEATDSHKLSGSPILTSSLDELSKEIAISEVSEVFRRELTANCTRGPLELRLVIEKNVFRKGEPIKISVVLKNIGDKPVMLVKFDQFFFDVEVYGPDSGFLFSLRGREAPVLSPSFPCILMPSESISEILVWNQTYPAIPEETVRPGSYSFVGILTCYAKILEKKTELRGASYPLIDSRAERLKTPPLTVTIVE
jgi:hypothetical protein